MPKRDHDETPPKTTRRVFLAGASAAGALATGTMPQADADDSRSEASASLRQRVLQSLGGDWPEPPPLSATVEKTGVKDGCRLEWVRYQLSPDEQAPAILILPPDYQLGQQRPAIAVWHQHAGQWHLGKSEPAGLAGDPMHHTGLALAKAGYVVLCPDTLCFEERQDPEGKLKGGAYERFEFLRYVVEGKCLAWKNIYDMRRAIDYLQSREEVAGDRIGCYGHSMGSTHTWLVGPWERRIKCLVGNCCLPTYAGIHRERLLHCFPNFVPGLFEFADTPDLAGLIAPRPLHLNFGELDGGSPIDEVRIGLKTIAKAYVKAGAAENFTHYVEPQTGHVLSPAMWKRTREFFSEHLNNG